MKYLNGLAVDSGYGKKKANNILSGCGSEIRLLVRTALRSMQFKFILIKAPSKKH